MICYYKGERRLGEKFSDAHVRKCLLRGFLYNVAVGSMGFRCLIFFETYEVALSKWLFYIKDSEIQKVSKVDESNV